MPNAVELLEEVENTINRYGRPRKNPGKGRPAAILRNGMVIKKITSRHIPELQHISLLEAFRYVEITGGYMKTQSEKAKRAFYEVGTGQNGFGYSSDKYDPWIALIDQQISDSRQITRKLRAARKKLRKSQSDKVQAAPTGRV